MNVTKKCKIEASDTQGRVKFVLLEAVGKGDDVIDVNKVNGLRLRKVIGAFQHPVHEDRPTWYEEDCQIRLGGPEQETKRTLAIIGL